jgi:hypothetical protein
MKLLDQGNAVVLWLSAQDTERWASRPGAAWPCSTLAGKRVWASFDTNGLYELAINGRTDVDCDAHELSAICADHLEQRIRPDHPVYFVTVGQFKAKASV